MSSQVVVVIPPEEQTTGLGALVRALDAQTMPSSQLEILLPDAGLGSAERERTAHLAARRPHVRVVAGSVLDAVAGSSARWVMVLDGRDVNLRAAALQRLVERGDAADADLVLGRVDLDGGRELDDVLARDADRAEVSADVVASSVVLQRREHALTHAAVADEASARAVLADGPAVAVVGSYLCSSRRSEPRRAELSPCTITSTQARWDGGGLLVEVEGQVSAVEDAAPLMWVRATSGHDDHPLDTTGQVGTDGLFVASARVDPATVADGAALPAGRWTVIVGVHGHTQRLSHRRNALRVDGLPSALTGAGPLVVETSGAQLVLDAGATKTSIVGRVAPADVDITETFRGTLMRARLHDVTAPDGLAVDGRIVLDTFALPARVVSADGAVWFEAYLSGLVGRMHLSTEFGGTSASMGLALVITATGQMRVEAQQPPARTGAAGTGRVSGPSIRTGPTASRAKAGAPAKGAASSARPTPPRQTPSRQPTSLVQRTRAALPAGLDPLLHAARRNRTLARLYRRAAGLPRR